MATQVLSATGLTPADSMVVEQPRPNVA